MATHTYLAAVYKLADKVSERTLLRRFDTRGEADVAAVTANEMATKLQIVARYEAVDESKTVVTS